MTERKKQLVIVRGGGDLATGTSISSIAAVILSWCWNLPSRLRSAGRLPFPKQFMMEFPR